jgi:hypothetical protein
MMCVYFSLDPQKKIAVTLVSLEQVEKPEVRVPVICSAAPVMNGAAPIICSAAPVTNGAAPVISSAVSVISSGMSDNNSAAPIISAAMTVASSAAPVLSSDYLGSGRSSVISGKP